VFITAFYSFRMLFLAFHGNERFGAAGHAAGEASGEGAHDASSSAGAEPDAHAQASGPPKESPWVITVPLILLAIPSVYSGWAYIEPMLFGDYFGASIVVAEKHAVLKELAAEWHGAGDFIQHGLTSAPFWLAIAGIAALVAATLVPAVARAPSNYIVGAKTFTEQYILSALIAERLRSEGLSATSREGLGSNVIFDALASNEVDVYVDYSGTLWANQFHHTDVRPRAELLGELKDVLAKQNITLFGELGFENAYALVMTRKRAEQLGIRSIADLVPHATGMSIAADYEFFSRPEWAGVKKAYGIAFREQRQMQPDFMYAAVASGEVDVITGYTSDGLIAKYDLVALDDPRHAIPPYDAILLLAPKRAGDERLQAALKPLLGKIDIATMREANLRASGNDSSSSPDAVARWLWDKVGKR